MIKAIVVVDKNLAIGNKGKLLFRIPSDLKHFKKETLLRTVIMGRKTLASMPKGQPLKGRNTLVLSKTMPEGLLWMNGSFFARSFKTKEALLSWAAENLPGEELVVAGGEQIYRMFIEDCRELIVTELEETAPEADAWFPPYKEDFEEYAQSAPVEENGLHYTIKRYRRK